LDTKSEIPDRKINNKPCWQLKALPIAISSVSDNTELTPEHKKGENKRM
jgi:hypothetical protein